MSEGKRASPEGRKCPSAALLPEAIFNYVLTVEEYDLLFLRERCQKTVKEPGKL